MNENPLVTVITGYHNRKLQLKESVESVLNQSYKNIQYIIFDDCSTDGTRELLQEFKDERIKLVLHPFNIGFTKGVINSILYAKGDYIAIHGAGDISYPKRIEKQIKFLIEGNFGMVGCSYEDVFQDKVILKETSKNFAFSHGEIMFKKYFYGLIGGYNKLLYYGQFSALKKEFEKISKLGSVPEVLYKRIHHLGGVTKNPDKRFAQKFFVKVGVDLTKSHLSLMTLNKNRILMNTYFSEKLKSTRVSDFFKYYDGNIIIKFLFKLNYLKLLNFRLLKIIVKISSK